MSYVTSPPTGEKFTILDDVSSKTPASRILTGALGSLLEVSRTNPFAVETRAAANSASGSITTQNLVPAGAATAGSAVELTLYDCAVVTFQITGTYTGVLSVQVTLNGTTWVTLAAASGLINVASGAYSATVASATQGIFMVDCSGYAKIRVTGLAAMTGTAAVTIAGNQGAAMVALDNPLPAGTNAIGVVDTEMPAAAALADGAANPTTPLVGSPQMLFNGATWDRARGNFNVNTGDTGAKLATGNGATQTNYNAKGATIAFNIGAVTGTAPTLVLKLQGSADGGTTWYDIAGAVTASITATGVSVLQVYPGIAAVANAAVSAPLPRTWRVVWTIGGTTPSFTITNVQVAYQL